MDMQHTKAGNARKASPESDAISRQLAAERAAARLTQIELARRSGVSRSAYIAIESGARVPDVTQLASICKVLGITLSELIARSMKRLDPPDALRDAR